MMTNDKMIQFVKRWRALEKASRDLDWGRSVLARDITAIGEPSLDGFAYLILWERSDGFVMCEGASEEGDGRDGRWYWPEDDTEEV